MDSRSGDLKYEEKKTDHLMPEDNVSDVVPLETIVWTEDQPATVQCGQHHDTLGDQCPSQPPLDQLPYPDFLMYPQSQQFSLHNSSITDAGDSGQSGTTSWFITEPILCSMMPGEVHPSEDNICVAFTMEDPNLEKGSLDSNHLTYPMLHNGNQNGQLLFMNSDSGSMFVTQENAPAHRNNSFCQEEVVTSLPLGCCADPDLGLLYVEQNASKNYSDFLMFSDYNQVACPSDSTETTTNRCCQASVSRTVGTSHASRSYKPCHCTKSKCLKLYCECFAAGVMCNNCNCTNCHNNPEHEAKRGKAIKSCLMRKPDAFRPKISSTESGEVKGWHSKGCNCKRSGCLKNYCECYEANVKCTPSCKCVDCRNYEADLADNENDKSRGSESVITPAVMEAVVGSMLACAAESERNNCSEAWGQHMVLSQFGLCLTEIVKAMFK